VTVSLFECRVVHTIADVSASPVANKIILFSCILFNNIKFGFEFEIH